MPRKWVRVFLGAAVLLYCPLAAEIRSLTILHTNDLHARLLPLENGNGGFAYLAAVIRRERANCSDCILLNAGDLVQGTPVSTISCGARTLACSVGTHADASSTPFETLQ